MKFPPDLTARVCGALERNGYCFLSVDELQRLLAAAPAGRQARHDALREFAIICHAEVETTPHLKSARFVPLAAAPQEAAQENLAPRSIFSQPALAWDFGISGGRGAGGGVA